MNTAARIVQLGLLISVGALSAAAWAQTPPPKGQNPVQFDFKPIDANSDGRVSLEEAKPNSDLVSAFEMLDVNHDDFLTPQEFSKWSRAGKALVPTDPTTAPSGSNGAQHMPDAR